MNKPSIAGRFDAVLKNLEPDPERQKLAEDLPALIRAELEGSTLLREQEPKTLLVGSYRRHTAICDIKDVDIAVLIRPELAAPTAPPRSVLDELAKALDGARRRKKLRSIERRPQRRSIRCEIPEHDFQLDIVPVVAVNGDPYGALKIPDCDLREWKETRSIGYLKTFSELNARSGDKLVRLVKLLKWWKNTHEIDRYQAKSFWIEALVVELVREGKITFEGSWADIVARACGALYERCLPVYNLNKNVPIIPDPMIPDANVAHNWKREGFVTFFDKLKRAHSAADQALKSEDATATKYWRDVFGPAFAPSWMDPWRTPLKIVGASAAAVGVVVVARRWR